MYFTDDGFVISAREITVIIVMMIIVPIVLKILYRKIRSVIVNRSNKSEDYPGSIKLEDIHEKNESGTNKFSDIADIYKENDSEKSDLDTERQEKVIFEEIISNVIFRYDEKTRMLTIEEKSDVSNIQQIKVRLNSFDDLRDFVDRLEEYVNE